MASSNKLPIVPTDDELKDETEFNRDPLALLAGEERSII